MQFLRNPKIWRLKMAREIDPKMPSVEQRVSHLESMIYKIAKELDIEIVQRIPNA